MNLYIKFRGREPKPDALIEKLGFNDWCYSIEINFTLHTLREKTLNQVHAKIINFN
jgi:hypothetical protein